MSVCVYRFVNGKCIGSAGLRLDGDLGQLAKHYAWMANRLELGDKAWLIIGTALDSSERTVIGAAL